MKEKEIQQPSRFKRYSEENKPENTTKNKFPILYMFNLVLDVYPL